MASIIKVDQLSEKTQGSGITLSHSLKNSSGSEIISSSGLIESPTFVGMIASFAMSSAPTGWIVCNGAEYAIADYGDLHTAIGTTWGALTNGSGGAGSTHFRVPDLRGEFLRGFDNGQGNDPDAASRTGGDSVGSSQEHALPALFGSWSNNHGNNRISVYNSTGLSGTTAIVGRGTSSWRQTIESASGESSRVDLDSIRVIPNGSDVRPRNKYVQYCIKY